jgi:hypothetical protein
MRHKNHELCNKNLKLSRQRLITLRITIRFVPHKEHIVLPWERPVGECCIGETLAVYYKNLVEYAHVPCTQNSELLVLNMPAPLGFKLYSNALEQELRNKTWSWGSIVLVSLMFRPKVVWSNASKLSDAYITSWQCSCPAGLREFALYEAPKSLV